MHAHRRNPHAHDTSAAGPRMLRLRYAATGVFMAFTWIGEGNAPAWEHALRTLVILLTLPPLLLRTNRRLTHELYETTRPTRVIVQLVTARIVIIVAAFGTSALVGHLLDPHTGRSPVLPAAGLALLLLSIPVQVRRAHRTRADRRHPSSRPAPSAPRLITAKLVLIAAGLLAQLLLGAYVDNATYVVAVAIATTATVLGPAVHRWLLVTHAPAPEREPVGDAA
ncbi:hypothetical protein [Streptomyces noursei]|uniref:hypothetical protein n=1 Tax=Streptomyces noursei TaxID=1971 RepID=UPI001678C602|nr:hypothetical protein [Streptomyces noursei]MCZ1020552.1 hypothetical protein [Streptomyces noursei]GGX12912.1 hypothetical protein GCM10010341_38000 [Streptomyces noursei]